MKTISTVNDLRLLYQQFQEDLLKDGHKTDPMHFASVVLDLPEYYSITKDTELWREFFHYYGLDTIEIYEKVAY